MKEYIEREAARDMMEQALVDEWEIQYADDRLDEIPAADVEEVRHGRWNNGYEVQNCSECGYRGKRSYHYCPCCGAKMDGGVNDGKID